MPNITVFPYRTIKKGGKSYWYYRKARGRDFIEHLKGSGGRLKGSKISPDHVSDAHLKNFGVRRSHIDHLYSDVSSTENSRVFTDPEKHLLHLRNKVDSVQKHLAKKQYSDFMDFDYKPCLKDNVLKKSAESVVKLQSDYKAFAATMQLKQEWIDKELLKVRKQKLSEEEEKKRLRAVAAEFKKQGYWKIRTHQEITKKLPAVVVAQAKLRYHTNPATMNVDLSKDNQGWFIIKNDGKGTIHIPPYSVKELSKNWDDFSKNEKAFFRKQERILVQTYAEVFADKILDQKTIAAYDNEFGSKSDEPISVIKRDFVKYYNGELKKGSDKDLRRNEFFDALQNFYNYSGKPNQWQYEYKERALEWREKVRDEGTSKNYSKPRAGEASKYEEEITTKYGGKKGINDFLLKTLQSSGVKEKTKNKKSKGDNK